MRIITLSSDGTNLLHPEAPVAERFKRYGRLVECFDALTLGPEDVEAALSEAVRVHVVRKAGLFSGMLRLVRRFGVLVRQNHASRLAMASVPRWPCTTRIFHRRLSLRPSPSSLKPK